MLAKFNIEHYHNEDEIRYIVDGRGLFHINSQSTPVAAIEVEPGDLVRVPRGTFRWFDLCRDRRIRAIRLGRPGRIRLGATLHTLRDRYKI